MISVIVVTYNQARILPLLLSSLEQQDYKGRFEVLICDDGSSDDTLSVVSTYAKRSLELRYLWQPHQGCRPAHSRNNGIRCARGEILIFIDGDCVAPPRWISSHVKAHKRGKKIVGGTRAWVEADHRRQEFQTLDKFYRAFKNQRTYPDLDRQKQLSRGPLPWTGCWSFNFSVPRHPAVLFDENIGSRHEDYELFCRLCHREGFTAVLKEDLEVLHIDSKQERSSSTSPWISDNPQHIEDFIKAMLYFTKKFPDLDLTEALWPLHYFQLDKESGRWRRARSGEKISVQKALAIADSWEQGIFTSSPSR